MAEKTVFEELKEEGVEALNRLVPWHELPLPLAIPNLIELRNQLRADNLHDTGVIPGASPPVPPHDASRLHGRTIDGTHNDLAQPAMGSVGARFGRNVPLDRTHPDHGRLLEPNPRELSRKLLTRDAFQPATTLNLLAAAWIQFQTHDWFWHGPNQAGRHVEIPLRDDDPHPHRPMLVEQTAADTTRIPGADDGPPTYQNHVTHWWDASQLYGSDAATLAKLRTGEHGKLRVQDDGRLPVDAATGLDLTGFTENWWLGLSLMHALFTREHNAICDALRDAYPSWTDEDLFVRARLVNAALLAKIHTVEWTPAILGHPALEVAMNANWYGLAGERVRELFGRISDSEVLSGIPGSKADHHGAPFAMTEEFVAVYRMHSLLPDDFTFWSVHTGAEVGQADLRGVTGLGARATLDRHALDDLYYSFGVAHPGALVLHNFPRQLQELRRMDGTHLDLGAVDLLRDRERGVPRYNELRRLLHREPVRSWEELTDNARWREELREAYGGDLEAVDPMIGMAAETFPKGFGFSDTAFRVFILMASRRLKSDRFYTDDFTPEVYSDVGLRWVSENGMKDVLLRHVPTLAPALRGVANAFAPWARV